MLLSQKKGRRVYVFFSLEESIRQHQGV